MNNIRLDIVDITQRNRYSKFTEAVKGLSETLHIPCLLKAKKAPHDVWELFSVLKGIYDKYRKLLKQRQLAVVEGVLKHYNITLKKADGSEELFKVKGKPVWNPNTGLMMTKVEWKRMSDAIDGFLVKKSGEYGYQLASEATTTGILSDLLEKQGKDIEKMSYKLAVPSLSDNLEEYLKENNLDVKDFRVSLINIDRTADYCTDMSTRTRQGIKHLIEQAAAEAWPKSRFGQELFDRFGQLNKDIDRLLTNEVNNAFNDGYLERIVEQEEEGEDIFVIGRSQSSACPICLRDINGVIARYVEKARSSDDETRKNSPATKLIWSGKTSIGYGAKDSWYICSRHPRCRCRIVRYYPD